MLTFSDVLCNDLDATVYRNLKFSIYTMSKTDCNFSPIPIKLGNAVGSWPYNHLYLCLVRQGALFFNQLRRASLSHHKLRE